jgi:hypothetical protein
MALVAYVTTKEHGVKEVRGLVGDSVYTGSGGELVLHSNGSTEIYAPGQWLHVSVQNDED